MMHQCTCKSLTEWVHKHLYQLQGVDAPAHVSLRLKTEGHTRTVTLLKVQNKQHTYITGFR